MVKTFIVSRTITRGKFVVVLFFCFQVLPPAFVLVICATEVHKNVEPDSWQLDLHKSQPNVLMVIF